MSPEQPNLDCVVSEAPNVDAYNRALHTASGLVLASGIGASVMAHMHEQPPLTNSLLAFTGVYIFGVGEITRHRRARENNEHGTA